MLAGSSFELFFMISTTLVLRTIPKAESCFRVRLTLCVLVHVRGSRTNDHVVARVTQWRATTKRAIIQVISEVVARTKRDWK